MIQSLLEHKQPANHHIPATQTWNKYSQGFSSFWKDDKGGVCWVYKCIWSLIPAITVLKLSYKKEQQWPGDQDNEKHSARSNGKTLLPVWHRSTNTKFATFWQEAAMHLPYLVYQKLRNQNIKLIRYCWHMNEYILPFTQITSVE